MDILADKTSSDRLALARLNISERWLRLAVPVAVFLAVLLPRLLGLDVFLTADEDDQIMFASLFLKSALLGDWGNALVLGYPGVPTLVLGAAGVGLRYLFHYAGWLPLPWVTADLMTTLDQVTAQFGVFEHPLDFITWVRAPMALVASVSILGIYWLLQHLLDRRIALLGALLVAFDPLILAHTRIIHVDAPLSYFMFLSFLAFLLYLDRGGWKWLLLSGLCGALAVLSKTPAALLGPILVASGLFYVLFPPHGLSRAVAGKRFGLALVGWGLVAVAAFFALWPAMWTRPLYALDWIIGNIRSVNQAYHPTTGIFWDEAQTDQNPLYYLVAFPYHLTPLTTFGVMAGLGLVAAGLMARWRGRAGESWAGRVLPLALSLVAYTVIFMAAVSAISRRGDRYILPVFFATAVLSALALWWLGQALGKRYPLQRFGLSPLRLLGGIALVQAGLVLLYHPYYLAYYNPVLGGYRTAPYRVNIGWGEGLDVAARYLNDLARPAQKTANPETTQVAAWYSNQFAPYYTGQTIDLSSEGTALIGAYTVFYINQVQRGFPSGEILEYFRQRQPLHVIELGGIPYAWIYPGPVISQSPPQGYTFAVGTILGGGARLVGLDVPATSLPADAFAEGSPEQEAVPLVNGHKVPGLPVTLYWETLAQIHGEHNIYIRLVDAEGNTWGQVDRLILAGLWRPDRWYSGYFVRDEYRLPVDPATPPGTYHLEVGMYDFETGQSYGVAKNIGQITLTPPRQLPQPGQVAPGTTLATAIDADLVLLGHDYTDATLPAGAEISGKIFWQAARRPAQDYQLQFSFLAPAGDKKYLVAETRLSGYDPSEWRRSEVVGAAYRFRVPAVTPPGDYPLLVTVIDAATGAAIGPDVTLARLTVEAHARNFKLPDGVAPVSAYLNDEIELVGYRLHDQTVKPRDSFGLTLYWRSLRPAADNYTVFIHAVGPDQVMRGQWDSVPAQGARPTSGWLPGEIIEDSYQVPMARDAPPWKYDIFVGMYDAATGDRLPASSEKTPTSDNRVWLTRVQVSPPEE